MNFQCAHCNRICDWNKREPAVRVEGRDLEVKTVGSRFCNAPRCLEADSVANGLPMERIRAMHGLG